jgi:hypothetical protein
MTKHFLSRIKSSRRGHRPILFVMSKMLFISRGCNTRSKINCGNTVKNNNKSITSNEIFVHFLIFKKELGS